MTARGCPALKVLERGYWNEDAAVAAHVSECERCAGEWARISELADLSSALPEVSGNDPAIRDALMSMAAEPTRRVPSLRWGAVAAAVLVGAVVLWPKADHQNRATVLAHEGARFSLANAQPDEIVRLVDGTITVRVDPLQPNERFRVITGDAEVEVVGTVFDVTAKRDALVSVRVIRGIVEVRADGRPMARLTAGDRWPSALIVRAPPLMPERPPNVEGSEPELPASHAEMDLPRESASAQRRPIEPVSEASSSASEAAPQTRRPIGHEGPVEKTGETNEGAAAPTEDSPDYQDAWTALRAEDFAAAALGFAKVQQREGSDVVREDAAFWRAVALGRAGDPQTEDALRAFLAAYPRSPRVGEASAMLGWWLFDSGRPEQARPFFEAAANDSAPRIRRSGENGLRALKAAN